MWKTFKDCMPQLGMKIEIMAGERLVHFGTICLIEDLHNGWFSFNSDYMVGAAVCSDYKWREAVT